MYITLDHAKTFGTFTNGQQQSLFKLFITLIVRQTKLIETIQKKNTKNNKLVYISQTLNLYKTYQVCAVGRLPNVGAAVI